MTEAPPAERVRATTRRRLLAGGAEGRPSRRWLVALLAIAVLGLGLRYAALATAEPCRQPDESDLSRALVGDAPADAGCILLTDAPVYHEQAVENAKGYWYQSAELDDTGRRSPSALHPPLYAAFLSTFTLAGVEDFDLLRALAVVLGAATIVLSGLVARRLAGDRAGLLAAGLVAVHPMVWINDVVLMSEGLYAVVVPLVVWAGYRAWERRDLPSSALLGASIGAAALVRSEAILLVAVVGVPLLLGAGRLWKPAAWQRLGAVAVVAGLVVLPWVGWNLLRFNQPVLFTTTAGFSLAFANCDAVYDVGPELGTRSPRCLDRSREEYRLLPDHDQSDVDAFLIRAAREEITADPGGAALAGSARVGRMWGLYEPFETIRREEPLERRGIGRSQLAVVAGWAVMALGAYGAVLLRRRGLPLSPLLGWVATSTIVAFVNLGLHRFRASSDVALCLLAAVALDSLWRAWRGRSDRVGT